MKRIFILIAILMLFCVGVKAEEIVIEAENYNQINFMPLISGDENAVLTLSKTWREGTEFRILYEFSAEHGGGYELSAVTSPIDSVFTSNFMFSINGGEFVKSGDVFKKTGTASTEYIGNSYIYTFGIVEIKEGKNTIEILVNEPRESDGAMAVFYMDYITLTKRDYEFYDFVPLCAASVFEEKDDVEFNVIFTDCPKETTEYALTVKNYYHKITGVYKFIVGDDEFSKTVNIGKYPCGWYSVSVVRGDKVIYAGSFSVVHDSEGRKHSEKIAADFASFHLVDTGKTDVERLARAVRLAGINTVRERYYWGDYESSPGSYNDYMQSYNNSTLQNAGLDVINMFCDTPSWSESTGYLSDNLFDVYNFQKDYAATLKGKVDIMEVWNEEDTSFASETADRFSSFFKAAAIGIYDGNPDMKKTFGGFAHSPLETDYMDFCMMNDIMEYADIYNYHSYAAGGDDYDNPPSMKKEDLRAHCNVLSAYGYENRDVWVTEGGIALNNAQERGRKVQARAAVINNVESLANGTDKHFFFVIPQYLESGREFGVFDKNLNPSTAYTALENLIYYIGNAEYKGILDNLRTGQSGYLFNNGENDVAILWSEESSYAQLFSDDAVTVVDMVGIKKKIAPINGIINIPIGADPQFIILNSEYNAEHCLKKHTSEKEGTAVIDDAKKIVIQQTFEDKNCVDEKIKGYLMLKGESNECRVTIYNFSDSIQSGIIQATVSDGFTLDSYRKKVTILPKKSCDITFAVSVDDETTETVTGFLKINGVMGGKAITQSASYIRYYPAENIAAAGYFEEAQNPDAWYTYKSTDDGTVTVTSPGDGILRFDVALGNGSWSYPPFKVENAEKLIGSDGIIFTVGADARLNKTVLHTNVIMKDGRKYFEGNSMGKTIKSGWTQYHVSWDDMVRLHLPPGVDPDLEFSVSDIAYISIGVNLSGDKNISYMVKDIGWYNSDGSDCVPFEKITIGDGTEEITCMQGEIKDIAVNLPSKDEIVNINVFLSGGRYNKYTQTENMLNINTETLEKGCYLLLVTAENKDGYIYKKSIALNIK